MTNIIYLIGRSGAGKYIIAKELEKEGYVIVDNQLINNPIFSLLKTDDLNSSLTVPLEAWSAIGKINILTNELFDDEEGDHAGYKKVEELAKKRDSTFIPLKLQISYEENEKRIASPGRLERYKSTQIDEHDRNRELIEVDHPNILILLATPNLYNPYKDYPC